jgi:ClpP class serine protease
MSRQNALMASASLRFPHPVLLESDFANVDPSGKSEMITALDMLASADANAEIASWVQRKAEISAAYGLPDGADASSKPFAFANGVAIIPIHGLLINRFPYSWGFITGYNFVVSQFNLALADADVKLIAFDVNSPGGMAAGAEECAQVIFDGRGEKPSIALIDSCCYSAAYYVSSSATRMVATPSSGVGSIGSVLIRMDYSGALKQAGIVANMIFKGDNKIDGYSMAPLTDAARARFQKSVDDCTDMFYAAVARNRDLEVADIADMQASCFSAIDGKSAGLIDDIATPQYAIEAMLVSLDTPDDSDGDPDGGDPDDADDIEAVNKEGQTSMTDAEIAAAQAAAVQAAVQADRARGASILGCAEAAGKTALATTLAGMGMSLTDAQTALKAAAPEVAAAVPAPAPAANPLETAMQTQGTPGVQPVVTGAGAQPEMTAAEKIMLAQDKATGSKSLEAHRKRNAALN